MFNKRISLLSAGSMIAALAGLANAAREKNAVAAAKFRAEFANKPTPERDRKHNYRHDRRRKLRAKWDAAIVYTQDPRHIDPKFLHRGTRERLRAERRAAA